MRSILYLSIIFFTAISLTGCYKKDVIVPINPIEGSWVLDEAAQGNTYGWRSFYTGLETGIFDFYSNGQARYTDGNIIMDGNWYITTVNDGYYDEYGNYYSNVHQSMEIHMYDNYTRSSVDLYFDDINFKGNRFVATYYHNHYIEKYWFSRY